MTWFRVLVVLVGVPVGVSALVALASPAVDPALRAQLDRVARLRIYFGHQSVGYDMVQGLAELSTEAGVPLRIAEVQDSLEGAGGGFLHGRVGENTRPETKLEDFRRAVGSARAPAVDVALMKLCYVDVDERTDAAALFARYQAVLAEARAASPGTTFVHVTVPLTTVQGGLKAFVKQLLGRKPYGAAENLRREQYNELLRRAYAGREPVLDVARVESTTADGKPFTVEWEGKPVPAMVPAYTSDGGHLAPEGRRRVARELVSVLASVQPRAPGGTARR